MNEKEQDDLSQELTRIRGELSAACAILGLALHLASHGDTETIRSKILEFSADAVGGTLTDDPHWREGVERFKHRLLDSLPGKNL